MGKVVGAKSIWSYLVDSTEKTIENVRAQLNLALLSAKSVQKRDERKFRELAQMTKAARKKAKAEIFRKNRIKV